MYLMTGMKNWVKVIVWIFKENSSWSKWNIFWPQKCKNTKLLESLFIRFIRNLIS